MRYLGTTGFLRPRRLSSCFIYPTPIILLYIPIILYYPMIYRCGIWARLASCDPTAGGIKRERFRIKSIRIKSIKRERIRIKSIRIKSIKRGSVRSQRWAWRRHSSDRPPSRLVCRRSRGWKCMRH